MSKIKYFNSIINCLPFKTNILMHILSASFSKFKLKENFIFSRGKQYKYKTWQYDVGKGF